MPTSRLTFSKQERIVSEKLMQELFDGGSSKAFTVYPLRAVWMRREATEAAPAAVQLLISVPKRKFHHAVDRNRAKRQLREAFRHTKHIVTDALKDGETVAMALLWIADRHFTSAEVAARVETAMNRIARQL